mgnify:CR=1 FL=1
MSTYNTIRYGHLATAAQGTKADSALQSVTEANVTAHQTALTIAESQVTGLTAALAAKVATSALAAVATSGAYSDLSGAPTNVSSFTNDASYATSTDVSTAINNLIGSAPGTLDTLEEIATSISNNATVYDTLNAAITNKLASSAISTFGLTLVDDADAAAARTTLGLGTAAQANTSDYATAAQGALAASALQSESSHADVVVDGDFASAGLMTSDGSGTYSITAAADFATAAQGTKADSAVQPAAIASMVEVNGDGDIDQGTNKILYSNMYAALADLPTASNYHGMFAHVHATGKAYFAHGGNWIALANDADVGASALDFDSAIKTISFSAAINKGYFVDTTTQAVSVTLPASPSVGNEVHVIDSANGAATNNITIVRNGNPIASSASDLTVAVNGAAFRLIWSGSSTFGWVLMNK